MSRQAHPDSLGEFRRPELDELCGIAILLTLILHYISRSNRYPLIYVPQPLLNLLDSFWSGVGIFFVLSGFLIGGIILDRANADNFFAVFYSRRFLRIFPPAILTIIVVFTLFPAASIDSDPTTLIPRFRLDGFALGILAAAWVRNPGLIKLPAQARSHLRLALIGIVMTTLAFSACSDYFELHQRIALGISLNSLSTAAVIPYQSMFESSRLKRALSSNWLVQLGRRPYCIYLIHMPILAVAVWMGATRPLQPVLAFALCILISVVSWKCIEAPLTRYGRRYVYQDCAQPSDPQHQHA